MAREKDFDEWSKPNPWLRPFEEPGLDELAEYIEVPSKPMKGRPKSATQKDFERVLYSAEVIRMRANGATQAVIAEKLGITVGTVRAIVKRAIKRTMTKDGIEEARTLEVMRLDKALSAVMPMLDAVVVGIENGGTPVMSESTMAAIDAVLKIGKARRELLGLDAAKKYELTGGIDIGASDRALALGDQLARFMQLADSSAQLGLGSGAQDVDISEEARLAGVKMRPIVDAVVEEDVVDAEIVE